MDAKHTERRAAKPTETEQQSAYTEMNEKARMVHAGLKRELADAFPFQPVTDFDEQHFLIATNKQWGLAFSPATFAWEPWTSFLFAGGPQFLSS